MIKLSDDQIGSFMQRIPGCLRDEPMSKHTNFRIGGPARLYVAVHGVEALMQAVEVAEELSIPWYVFGGGSNLLVADEGYEGLVIQSALRTMSIDGDHIRMESGVITALVARKAADAGLGGFEWAIGVPGTIGGAVYGDAGCYGGEMKDVVETVEAYRISDRQVATYTNAECRFGYRESRFKTDPHIILACTIRLKPGDADVSKKRMQEIVETRKLKQPLEQSSAGCAFKNVALSDPVQIAALREAALIPPDMLERGVVSAGWAVEHAGARGWAVGGVMVSEKHGNFLVNTGGAKAADVIALMSSVKAKVQDVLGIALHEEVQLLGF